MEESVTESTMTTTERVHNSGPSDRADTARVLRNKISKLLRNSMRPIPVFVDSSNCLSLEMTQRKIIQSNERLGHFVIAPLIILSR